MTLDPLKLIKCVFCKCKDNLLLLNQDDIFGNSLFNLFIYLLYLLRLITDELVFVNFKSRFRMCIDLRIPLVIQGFFTLFFVLVLTRGMFLSYSKIKVYAKICHMHD